MSAQACNDEGRRLSQAGKFLEALAVFEQGVAEDPRDAALWFNRGNCLFALKRVAEAGESYQRAAAANPRLSQAHVMRGVVLSELGRLEEGLACLDEGIRLEAGEASYWANRGHILNQLELFEDGLASCEKALSLDERQPDAWNNKGIALERLLRFEDAYRAFSKAVEAAPGHARAAANKARALENLRLVQAARDLMPSDAAGWLEKGGRLGGTEALACYEQAAKLAPQDERAKMYVTILSAKCGLFPQAFVWAKTLADQVFAAKLVEALRYDGIEADGNPPPGVTGEAAAAALELGGRAEDLAKKGRFAPAAELAARACRLNPRCCTAWSTRGYALDELGKLEEALGCYDRVLALFPDRGETWMNKGVTLSKLKSEADAVVCFETACRHTPDNGMAWRNWAASLTVLKRYEEALACYDHLLQREPADPKLWKEKASCLYALGRSDEGYRCMEKALQDKEFAEKYHEDGLKLFGQIFDAPPAPAPEARTAYQKGQVIGQKYEVVSVLGQGGFGVVYEVHACESKAVYALKTLREELLADAGTRELFLREARLWVDLDRHPYLVRAFFIDELHGRYYIAMELVEGPSGGPNSLEAWLKGRKPDLAQTLRWAVQLCLGMEYAHGKGLRCHRDLKPGNILIGKDSELKITDFGLAGLLGSSSIVAAMAVQVQGSAVGLTCAGGEGKGAGTATHMPPEQFKDTFACDTRSDVYAAGVILHQLVTGRLPFLAAVPRDGSQAEARRFWRDMEGLHATAPVPAIDSPLEGVILRCLEKEPGRRYPDFSALRAELEPVLQRLTGETIAPPQPKDLAAWEWNNKGVSLNDLGRFEEAIACFHKSLELEPGSAKAVSNVSLTLNSLRRHQEAWEWAQKAVALDAQEITGWINRAVAEADLGRHEEAQATLEKALALKPDHLGAWNNKAISLMALGRYAQAVPCLDRVIAIDARIPLAWNNKGVCLDNLQKPEEALACYEKAVALDPFQHMAWMNMAIIKKNQGKLEEALRLYQKTLEIKPDYPNTWYNKAILEEKLARPADAARSYERFLALGPPAALAQKAKAAVARLAALNQARPTDVSAASAGPQELRQWLEQGQILRNQGQHERALECFDLLLSASDDNPLAWGLKGHCLRDLGRLDEAQRCYARSLELKDSNEALWYESALCCEALQRLDDAVAHLTRALALEPDSAKYWSAKGGLLLRQGKTEEALADVARALSIEPLDALALFTKAILEEKAGRPEEAARCYRLFLNAAPIKYKERMDHARGRLKALGGL